MTEFQYLERAEALRAKLYHTALLMLGNETASIDAVDEAVYRGYRSFHKLRQPDFLNTWLTRQSIKNIRIFRKQLPHSLTEQAMLRR